jgi:hypothetical protein
MNTAIILGALVWLGAVGYAVFELLARRAERKRDASIIRWQRPSGPVLPPVTQERPNVRLVGGERR